MDVYADRLFTAIETAWDVRQCVPESGRRWRVGQKLWTWADRYVRYPIQARRFRADVNHIVEHGYAHLLTVLDPERTVVTVHDLIPLLSWRGLVPGLSYPHRPRLAEYSLAFLRKARRVFAISNRTRQDLVSLGVCPAERIDVVPYGVDERFQLLPAAERTVLRKKLGLPEDTRLILITGHQAYKNHGVCLQVLREVGRSSARPVAIVRVGQSTPEWEDQRAKWGHGLQVIPLPVMAHARMIEVYNAVDCLLFPSLYEGFGWPPLEAMACGLPVVTSNAASLPEVVGDAALVRDPADVAGLAEDVRAVFTQPALSADLRRRGLQRAAGFTWQRHAEQVGRVYAEIVGSE
jgi:glycosyltransferase involved in cell wall biosynthesis